MQTVGNCHHHLAPHNAVSTPTLRPMYVHFEAPCLRLWTSYYCKLRAEVNMSTRSCCLVLLTTIAAAAVKYSGYSSARFLQHHKVQTSYIDISYCTDQPRQEHREGASKVFRKLHFRSNDSSKTKDKCCKALLEDGVMLLTALSAAPTPQQILSVYFYIVSCDFSF